MDSKWKVRCSREANALDKVGCCKHLVGIFLSVFFVPGVVLFYQDGLVVV